MSDLDTLIVTFQTQLSDVMETVVKTAMYEVTRLVEDGFLEEVQRRNQEVESLRRQLQWAEKKLSDQGGREGGKTGRCVDCAKDDVDLSSDTVEDRPKEQQDDILGVCGVKQEGDSVEKWAIGRTQEYIPESTQAADNPTSSPERESQECLRAETPEDDVMSVLSVKEEVNKPSFSSVHWSDTLDETSDVVPGICWSHSPRLCVTALSAPITTGTTVAFTTHFFSSSSFSPWYFSRFSCFFFLMLLLHMTTHTRKSTKAHDNFTPV